MTSIDTNVSNYTLSELMAIVGINEDGDMNTEEIISKTNALINKSKNRNNPEFVVFLQEIQSQLLQFAQGLEVPETKPKGKIIVEGFTSAQDAVYPGGEQQVTDWYENENLTQSDQNQVNKITQRKQKIGIFGNQHVPMKRDQIATTDTYNLPVKQDSLNPNLKNTISRFVNLDSQFRHYTTGQESSTTNYTCDLSDTLKDTLSIRLYSYQIPYSWYAIDSAYGNTCFWIVDSASQNAIPVSIPSGNYSQLEFQNKLNASFLLAGFTFPPYNVSPYDISANSPVYYNANSGIITLFLDNGIYTDISNNLQSFIITSTTIIIFYDFTGILQCNTTCQSKVNRYFNNTLGWLMGYRIPYVNVDPSGNQASSVLNLNGTKYLILVIDDYNQNHVNNSVVSITQFSNTLKIPDYYSPDLPYICQQPTNNLQSILSGFEQDPNNQDNGLLIAGKYQESYSATQTVLPSAPRTLTNAQIYTINEINRNNNNLTNYLTKAPTSSDILGIIPVKTSVGIPTGSLLVEFSGSLQDNSRTYFGPVNIDRMAIKLLDDKGNILNLNGNDWCFTLVCDCLYQY